MAPLHVFFSRKVTLLIYGMVSEDSCCEEVQALWATRVLLVASVRISFELLFGTSYWQLL
jgi:hypothetical protein